MCISGRWDSTRCQRRSKDEGRASHAKIAAALLRQQLKNGSGTADALRLDVKAELLASLDGPADPNAETAWAEDATGTYSRRRRRCFPDHLGQRPQLVASN